MPAFMPQTLEGWLIVIGTIVTWIFVIWKIWNNLVSKVNGVGARVTVLEEKKAENTARIERVEAGHSMATADRAHIHERLGGLTKENESLVSQITDLKIDVIGHINEVKAMIKEDTTSLRERVIRLEVRNEMRDGGKKDG